MSKEQIEVEKAAAKVREAHYEHVRALEELRQVQTRVDEAARVFFVALEALAKMAKEPSELSNG